MDRAASNPSRDTDRSRFAPAWLGVALAVTSAVLLVVTWQAYGNLWWLTPIAFVPMYVAQYRLLPRRWSGLAVGIAAAGFWGALLAQGSTVLPWPLVVAGALTAGGLWWFLGSFQRPFSERTDYRWFIVQMPLFWVGVDLAIQNNEITGTYNWIAYHLSAAPPLVHAVSILSTPALSFLLLMINAGIALVVLRLLDARHPGLTPVPIPQPVVRWSSVLVGATTVLWIGTSVLIHQQVTDRMGPVVRVATVQPGLADVATGLVVVGLPHPERPEPERIDAQKRQLTALTKQAAARGAQLVVWPEEVLSYDPRVEHTKWIPHLVRETGIYLVQGFVIDPHNFEAPNTALTWGPDGTVQSVYLKTERVLAEGEAFPPGTLYPITTTSFGRLGVIICFDIDFPNGPARRETLSGAQIIAAPSIDFASGAIIRTASTVFRSIENRVGFAKADLAWDSVVIAPNGRVIARTLMTDPRGGEAILVEDLPLGPADSPFSLYGGTPFQWLLNAAWLFLLAVMVSSWRRIRAANRAEEARVGG